MEGAPTYDKSCWTDIKDKLGLDFPNLPYFLDGNIKITQSNAILRHIARKNGLCGESVEEKARVDMMADCAMDLRNTIVRLVYNPDYVMMTTLRTDNHILFFSTGQPVAPIY
jgi:glutathione S-transferase